jgi:hypothetical protein
MGARPVNPVKKKGKVKLYKETSVPYLDNWVSPDSK